MKRSFPLFVLFSFFYFCTKIALAIDPQFEACEPRHCGNSQNISYPFWIDGQPSYCGYKGFQLACNNNKPVLNMSNGDSYYVQNIFYQNQSLLVVNTKLFDDKTCPWPIHSLTFERTPFNLSHVNANLNLFFHCKGSLSEGSYYDPSFPSLASKISCMSNDTYSSYATFLDYGSLNDMGLESCESSAVEPVMLDVNPMNLNHLNYSEHPNYGNYSELLKGGFVLDWTSSNCSKCVESGGRCGYNDSTSQIVCFCPDEPHLDACGKHDGNTTSNMETATRNRKIAIGVGAGIGGLLLMCFFFFTFGSLFSYSYPCMQKFTFSNRNCFLKKKTNDSHNVELFLMNYGSQALKRYSYSNIKKITNSFKEKLGRGGFGSVFKGKLSDGRLVAVKILEESKGNGEEFINEVASIGRTYHVNIVPLLGFCSEGSKRALIYEFMPNGSLEKFIYTDKPKAGHPLGWKKLYDIALGIARGLEYLHRGCTMRILHFDIKPHNILLDQDFCPKISDFGLAKSCPTKESTVSMSIARGTVGYIAPELCCRDFGGVSYKSDVYSYGMMIIEMVGGRKNIDALVENTSEIFFPQWVYRRIELHQDLGLHGMVSQAEEEIARKMIIVGLWCIQTSPTDRPSMGRVIEMLEGSLESLPMPPNPILSSPSTPSVGCSVALR